MTQFQIYVKKADMPAYERAMKMCLKKGLNLNAKFLEYLLMLNRMGEADEK